MPCLIIGSDRKLETLETLDRRAALEPCGMEVARQGEAI